MNAELVAEIGAQRTCHVDGREQKYVPSLKKRIQRLGWKGEIEMY